ncbi:Rossmann-like and DUF2520 domain-containing protein [Peptococcaceae bacterium 1198_IL3148]
MSKPTVTVVGAGKVGSAMAVALQRSGYPIVGVVSGSVSSAQALGLRLGVNYSTQLTAFTNGAQIVFITTPDREVVNVVTTIANNGGFKAGQIIVHTSGSIPSTAINIARQHGALVAAFHPLQSFADVETAILNLPGSYFAIEGDADALPVLNQLLNDLHGHGITINPEDKPLYHAAAVVASNYLVAIIHLATEMLAKLGLERQQSVPALWPLIMGTLNNIEKDGTIKALTGPVERGDSITLDKHIKAINELGAVEQQVYQSLGKLTVALALQKESINQATATELINILEGNKNE